MQGDQGLRPVDKSLNRFERFRNDISDLKQRWDNRIVLERCSLSELYIDCRLEIVLYGDWRVGPDEYLWVCRIACDSAVIESICPNRGVYPADSDETYCRNEVGMFVLVAHGGKVPKVLVRSVFRPYLFQKKLFKAGDGLIYRRETGMGWEVFPWRGREIERFSRIKIGDSGYPNALGGIIQCGAEIAKNVTNDIRKRYWDFLFGPVGQLVVNGWIEINERTALQLGNNLVEGSIQGRRKTTQPVNIAVGPLNFCP